MYIYYIYIYIYIYINVLVKQIYQPTAAVSWKKTETFDSKINLE